MRAFLEPLRQLGGIANSKSTLKRKGIVQVSGCIDAGKAHIAYALSERSGPALLVTYNEQRAKELAEEYRFFHKNTYYYPARDILFYQSDIKGNLLTSERMSALKAAMESPDAVLVTTFDALMDILLPPEKMKAAVLTLEEGGILDLEEFARQLVQMGYEKNYQVEMPGQFAVRGGIFDIYPLTEETPVRIELWDDEIDSIRYFDVESQRSLETAERVQLFPAGELVLEESEFAAGLERMEKEADRLYVTFRNEMKTEEAHRIKTSVAEITEYARAGKSARDLESYITYFIQEKAGLLDYFDRDTTFVFLDEPVRLLEKGKGTSLEFQESMEHRLEKGYLLPGQADALRPLEETAARLLSYRCIALSTLDANAKELPAWEKEALQMKSISPYNNQFELLIKDLKQYKRKKYKVILLSGSTARAKRLAADLLEEGLNSFFTEDYDRVVQPCEVMVAYGKLRRGYEFPDAALAIISESDIFGAEKKKRKRKSYEGEHIADFSDLKIGDYVVHENHGLGIYRGIEKVDIEKTQKDYIKIEYAKGGTLYILATQLEMIQKYAGAEAKKPKLNRLGGQEWGKTKIKVRQAVSIAAKELVELYALRQQQEGYQFDEDTEAQREFEERFPFEETEDQIAAIEDTKRDMQSKKIMDRLICGDVGFGKTEIAIRAAYKAALEGKQTVFLVPTTILAQQHYNTFTERMKDSPVNIELLCRFRTSAQQKKSIERLKKGLADIVIGTHRVLSKDVEFHDLGLLIIDEEQRFGVTHKEKIKKLRKNVDALTLTATPIPRTLHMSLAGIRDMSLLEEPPMDRVPIQTYVMEYNEEMVRESICRELARGGQVFYVYNRVNRMEEVTAKIRQLVPEATVAFANGQMREQELERIMVDFINGELDVLVSTTIIETGMDIANVNTIIIQDSENLGLSQLYQLRGRVGRSSRTAYAFFLYQRGRLLKEVAEKRLSAIKEYTELGSGFKIAMRDLEIRGAGNLLGEAQHGHMEAVGYDLYCKMLNEAVKKVRGIEVEESFETTVDMRVDAYIPMGYIKNEHQKLDIYKRIAGIETKEEASEMTDELIDRFGEPPTAVCTLIRVAELKAQAHKLYFTEIVQKGEGLKATFYEKAKIHLEKIPLLVEQYHGRLKFYADSQNPYFLLNTVQNSRQAEKNILEVAEKFLEEAGILTG